jgi:hypothetical protein
MKLVQAWLEIHREAILADWKLAAFTLHEAINVKKSTSS